MSLSTPSDEEPLFEISKIHILNEHQPVRRSRGFSTYKKNCFVPLCPNSSVSTPEKMFITIPVNPPRRKAWFDAVGKPGTKNPKSPLFCCEDHFDLENDMINYEEHLIKGKVQMLLKKTAVPQFFLCNDYGHLSKTERIEVLQRLHKQPGSPKGRNLSRNESLSSPESDTTVMKVTKRERITIVPTLKTEEIHYVSINENGIETIIIDDDSGSESSNQ